MRREAGPALTLGRLEVVAALGVVPGLGTVLAHDRRTPWRAHVDQPGPAPRAALRDVEPDHRPQSETLWTPGTAYLLIGSAGLVPVAAGYVVAHYLPFALLQGPAGLVLAGDPFDHTVAGTGLLVGG